MTDHANFAQNRNLVLEHEQIEGVLTIEQPTVLQSILSELKHTHQTLKSIKKLLEHSYVVDSIKIKQQNALFGKSMQEAFKIELANAMRGKSEVERLVDKAIEQIEAQINRLNAET